jgi:hypothetical protein
LERHGGDNEIERNPREVHPEDQSTAHDEEQRRHQSRRQGGKSEPKPEGRSTKRSQDGEVDHARRLLAGTFYLRR